MIINQQNLISIFCQYVKVKKEKTLQCNLPNSTAFDDNFYASYPGLFASVLFFALHLLIMILTSCTKRDYIKCFISAAYLPLCISCFFKIIHICFSISYPGEHRIGLGFDIISHIYTVALTAGVVSVFLGGIILLFMTVFATCSHSTYTSTDSWSIFLTVQFFGWLLSAIFNLTSFDFRGLTTFALVLVLGASILVFAIGLCCGLCTICSSKHKAAHEVEDPIVGSTRYRIICVIIYLVVVTVPAVAVLYSAYEEFILLTGDEYEDAVAVEYYYGFRIIEFFSGPLLSLAVFILPPIHTSFKFIGSFKKGHKVADSKPLLAPAPAPVDVVVPVETKEEEDAKIAITSEPNSSTEYPFKHPEVHPSLAVANMSDIYPGLMTPQMIMPGAVVPNGPSYIQVPPNCTATVVYTAPMHHPFKHH